jgi:hypothetical protein
MCRYAYGLYVMKDILFTHDGFQNNYYDIITRGSSFQFDENDIDRMRMELRSLISSLSPVYLESTDITTTESTEAPGQQSAQQTEET